MHGSTRDQSFEGNQSHPVRLGARFTVQWYRPQRYAEPR